MKTIKTLRVSVKALPSFFAILLMYFTNFAFAEVDVFNTDGFGHNNMVVSVLAGHEGEDPGETDSVMMLDQGGGNKKAGLPMGVPNAHDGRFERDPGAMGEGELGQDPGAMGEEEAGEGEEEADFGGLSGG
jgi:hypothetical protein